MLLQQPAARFLHDQLCRYYPIFEDHKYTFLADTETIKFYCDNVGNIITDILDVWVIKLNKEEIVDLESPLPLHYNQTHFLINLKTKQYKLLSSAIYTKEGHCLAYEDPKSEFMAITTSPIIENLFPPIVKYVRANTSFVFANSE